MGGGFTVTNSGEKLSQLEQSFLNLANRILVEVQDATESERLRTTQRVVPRFTDDGLHHELVEQRHYMPLLRSVLDRLEDAEELVKCGKIHLRQGIMKAPDLKDQEGQPILDRTYPRRTAA